MSVQYLLGESSLSALEGHIECHRRCQCLAVWLQARVFSTPAIIKHGLQTVLERARGREEDGRQPGGERGWRYHDEPVTDFMLCWTHCFGNSMAAVCFEKCVTEMKDDRLHIGEMTCLDRCSTKYVETQRKMMKRIQEQQEAELQQMMAMEQLRNETREMFGK